MDWVFSSTNLLFLWIFAGAVCFVPLIIRHQVLKYIVVVIVLSVVFLTFTINKEFIGRPRHDALIEDFFYKGHTIATVNGNKYITMWIHDGKDDLLIRFPYTADKQKILSRAREQALNGIPQKGKLGNKPKENIFSKRMIDLMMYDFPFEKRFPKN